MAPLPESSIRSYFTTLLKRTPTPSPSISFSNLSPKAIALAERARNLLPRGDPGAGVTPPTAIPNKAVFALFGLIGVGFVITGIWFFFWAKNGGFYFKENDWEDYKSTVLRRKGPNGTTLSGATASTDLGGGSVVHGENDEKKSMWGRKKKGMKRYKDFDEATTEMGSAGGSSLGSEMSDLKKSKPKKGKDRKERKSRKPKEATELMSEIGTVDGDMDPGVLEAVRAYRHEKPARVGGLNKQADGSAWDGSTQDNSTAASDLLSHREKTPTNTPTKIRKERRDNYTGGSGTGGIRKVVSTSEGHHSYSPGNSKAIEEDHIKSEARKLQEKGRAAQRRDFSFQAGDDSTVISEDRERRRASRSPTKKIPGSYYEESVLGSEVSGDIGTKSYHHPIPGLSSSGGSDYAEERRKKRNGGGYRRGNDDN